MEKRENLGNSIVFYNFFYFTLKKHKWCSHDAKFYSDFSNNEDSPKCNQIGQTHPSLSVDPCFEFV